VNSRAGFGGPEAQCEVGTWVWTHGPGKDQETPSQGQEETLRDPASNAIISQTRRPTPREGNELAPVTQP
jgi:hypothetical protein